MPDPTAVAAEAAPVVAPVAVETPAPVEATTPTTATIEGPRDPVDPGGVSEIVAPAVVTPAKPTALERAQARAANKLQGLATVEKAKVESQTVAVDMDAFKRDPFETLRALGIDPDAFSDAAIEQKLGLVRDPEPQDQYQTELAALKAEMAELRGQKAAEKELSDSQVGRALYEVQLKENFEAIKASFPNLAAMENPVGTVLELIDSYHQQWGHVLTPKQAARILDRELGSDTAAKVQPPAATVAETAKSDTKKATLSELVANLPTDRSLRLKAMEKLANEYDFSQLDQPA